MGVSIYVDAQLCVRGEKGERLRISLQRDTHVVKKDNVPACLAASLVGLVCILRCANILLGVLRGACSMAGWRAQLELASCYKLCERYGMDNQEGISTYVGISIPSNTPSRYTWSRCMMKDRW